MALLVAVRCPDQVRAVVVADSPLTAAAWRELASGQRPLAEVMEILKNAPLPGQAEPQPMREVMGEDAPLFPYCSVTINS